MSKRITISNSKGGVGKTISALSIIDISAQTTSGKVLAVDFDPQGDFGRSIMGRELDDNEPHIFHALLGNASIEDIIYPASENWRKNIHVLPAEMELTSLPKHIFGKIGYEKVLSKLLDKIESLCEYDLIVIDTPGQSNELTQIALRASNYAIITTDLSLFSERAIERSIDIVNLLREDAGHDVSVLKIVPTSVQKPGAKVYLRAMKSLKDKYGNLFFDYPVPHCCKVDESIRQGASTNIESDKKYYSASPISLVEEDHKLYTSYKFLTKSILEAK